MLRGRTPPAPSRPDGQEGVLPKQPLLRALRERGAAEGGGECNLLLTMTTVIVKVRKGDRGHGGLL